MSDVISFKLHEKKKNRIGNHLSKLAENKRGLQYHINCKVLSLIYDIKRLKDQSPSHKSHKLEAFMVWTLLTE